MNKELDEKLCRTYTDIFRERSFPVEDSAMGMGFSHDDGWHGLLVGLCAELAGVQKATGIEVIAKQVKEKFGTIRFYYMLKFDHIRCGLPEAGA